MINKKNDQVRFFRRLSYWAFTFMLMGCTSMKQGTYVEHKSVNASVSNIIKSFDKAAVGLRGRSANGREVVSKYHTPGGDGYDYASTNPQRAFSRLRILGERRPYNLQIQYVIETRNSKGVYSHQSYDQVKAKKVLKALMEYLVTRPDREDFIDDFRSF